MRKLPYKFYPVIILISFGFAMLAVQYTGDVIVGVAVGMLVSMAMINDFESED